MKQKQKRFPILHGSSDNLALFNPKIHSSTDFWQRVHLFGFFILPGRECTVGERENAADRTSPRRPLPHGQHWKIKTPHSWTIRPHIGFLYYSGENQVWFSLFLPFWFFLGLVLRFCFCFLSLFKAFFLCVLKVKRVESFSSFFVPTGRDVFSRQRFILRCCFFSGWCLWFMTMIKT
jgi:hypothetical protein